jgi:hypothetical protein
MLSASVTPMPDEGENGGSPNCTPLLAGFADGGEGRLRHSAFRWRTMLSDPNDDMVLETATNGSANAIVTFNQRDFASVIKGFRCAVILPAAAIQQIRSSNP